MCTSFAFAEGDPAISTTSLAQGIELLHKLWLFLFGYWPLTRVTKFSESGPSGLFCKPKSTLRLINVKPRLPDRAGLGLNTMTTPVTGGNVKGVAVTDARATRRQLI